MKIAWIENPSSGPSAAPMRIRRIKPDPLRAPIERSKSRRKKSRQEEHKNQKALFVWAAWNERKAPALRNLYAVPNAGKRGPIAAAMMKAEGLKKGMVDVVLAWPLRSKERPDLFSAPGLYIEMKAGSNKPTPEQLDWRDRLITAGYAYWLCYSWIEAANAILDYLGHELEPDLRAALAQSLRGSP